MNYIDKIVEAYNTIDRDELDKIVLDLNVSKGILVAGNGGSYANSTHFAQDLVKTCKIFAHSILDSVSLLTAVSNDVDYNMSVCYAAESFIPFCDTLFLISVSGNSPNIVNAAMEFRGTFNIVSLTGYDGGMLKELSDRNINVNYSDMKICESVHSIILHEIIQELVYATI